jgi:hypothetical protein
MIRAASDRHKPDTGVVAARPPGADHSVTALESPFDDPTGMIVP